MSSTRSLAFTAFFNIIVNCLGKTNYFIKPQQKICNYREDFAIIEVIDVEQEQVKYLIEVAYSVHPELIHSDISKLCECLLYDFYQLSEEKSARPIFCVLTDGCSCHILNVHITRQSILKINDYYKFSFTLSNLKDDNIEFIKCVAKLCNLL